MDTQDKRVFRFGPFEADLGNRQLFKNGLTVCLTGQPFDVLALLLLNPGELVTREQLRRRLWPSGTVVEFDHGIHVAVTKLREALGDDAERPRFIATVPRHGYRFIAPVSSLASPTLGLASATPISLPITRAAAPWRVRWTWVFIVAAAFAIGYPVAQKFWPSKQATTLGHETTVAAVAIGEPSVAVLPFIDVSEQRDEGYFADGLSEVLIDRLSMVPGLRVPARTSSFYFKGKQATVPEIGKALGVAHLLEGTVSKSGTTLRITARLVHTENGYQIWSETFDRPLSDVSKTQDEIAGVVVQVLKVSILATHGLMEPARTTNIEAYTSYFRAEANVVSNGLADYDVAAEQLRSAVTLDPQFAAAWARLALVTIWKFDVARAPGAHAIGAAPTGAACAAARAAADHALELDATLVASHRAKGVVVQYCDNNWLAAETEFKRALELQPGSSDVLRSYAWLALAAGRPAQALQLAQHALSLDPLNPWTSAALGDASLTVGRMADAEAAYRRAVELNPATAGLHAVLADILLVTGKAPQAVAEAEQESDTEWREAVLPFALNAAGRKGDADRAIAVYQSKHPDDAGRIGAFYACRDNADRAIQWLRSFAAKHEDAYHDLPYEEACLKNLESDVRYQVLRRMKPKVL